MRRIAPLLVVALTPARLARQAQVHALLAATPGQGRVPTELQLFSREEALDPLVYHIELSYDPFASSQGAASSEGA